MNMIFNLYDYFISNLPKDLKEIDCIHGGCGAFSLGLHQFFSENNINCNIVELNSGAHFFLYADNYSFDRYSYKKGLYSPTKVTNFKEHYNILSYNKAYKRITKKTFFKDKYINEFCNYAKKVNNLVSY